MLHWLKRKKEPEWDLPEYSAVRSVPTRRLPADLTEEEASPAFFARREVIERSLREPERRPAADRGLFVQLVRRDRGAVLTIPMPEGEAPCVPVFSTPFRAADYARTFFRSGPPVGYMQSSPIGLIEAFSMLPAMGIERFTLDRCPRCETFVVMNAASITTADEALDCWTISKATELARLDLYLSHAAASARAGALDVARAVALEAVSHVSFEDPRAHLLLGEIAVALRDRKLLRDAKAFLRFRQADSLERRLEQVIRSKSPTFEFEARRWPGTDPR